jgi:kynurenine formamidase
MRYALASIVITLTFCAQANDNNWRKWGADDQAGTLNYITPEVMRHAAKLVKKGLVYSLSIPVAANQPSQDRQLEVFQLTTGQGTGSEPKWLGDHLILPLHGTTHWDSLAHVFGDGKMYNGYDAAANITAAGALKNGIHHAARKIVTRGVLLDIARYKGVKRLDQGYVITREDMEGAAKKQGVTFRPGDVVLIRTGWLSIFRELDQTNIYDPKMKEWKTFHRNEPGIGWDAAQWLKAQRSAAVAADNLHLEALPAEPKSAQQIGHPGYEMPVNYELIRNQGMTLGKLFQLDELSEACAADGVYEFLFIAPPMKITNGTGSPTNPVAIK